MKYPASFAAKVIAAYPNNLDVINMLCDDSKILGGWLVENTVLFEAWSSTKIGWKETNSLKRWRNRVYIDSIQIVSVCY